MSLRLSSESSLEPIRVTYQVIENLVRRLQLYKKRVDRYLKHLKPYVENARVVVDIGCGSGEFSKALDDGKRLIIALNIKISALEGVRSTSIERVCANAHYLPLRENSIDCVLSLLLIEHLQKPREHIEELYRVVKSRGVVILQLPNLQYLIEPHTKWPLLWFMPKKFQSVILKDLNKHVNMNVTVRYALKAKFTLKKEVRIYHLKIMKLFLIAPAYIFIFQSVKSSK